MGSCHSRLPKFDISEVFANMNMSGEERSRNRQIENDIRDDFYKEKKIIKLLFLGAADSGKSTILKQMKLLHPMQDR